MARLKCLVCSSLPVSEVRPRFLSRSFRRRSLSSRTVSACACSKVFERTCELLDTALS